MSANRIAAGRLPGLATCCCTRAIDEQVHGHAGAVTRLHHRDRVHQVRGGELIDDVMEPWVDEFAQFLTATVGTGEYVWAKSLLPFAHVLQREHSTRVS